MLGPAWQRISGRKSFDDWLQVGHALAIGRTEALRAAGTNSPVGSKFNKAIGTWLAANGLDGVTAPEGYRIGLVIEHLTVITSWRESLSEPKQRKLKPNGIVAMHVSNYHLELATVVAGIADANGAIARLYDGGDVPEDASEQKWVPTVAAVARKDEDFGALANSRFWLVLPPDPALRVWTDDYSNVLGTLIRQLRQRSEPLP